MSPEASPHIPPFKMKYIFGAQFFSLFILKKEIVFIALLLFRFFVALMTFKKKNDPLF